ncbi:MAG TPA: formyl-CoA transferase [Candidatus Latescibacteria bacterium]|nr:formyl-CoA transferase [Gemmatimonadota bacterium]HCR19589.1 formyl-CoA transferase [Candidatus Latescibacterota bacterium]
MAALDGIRVLDLSRHLAGPYCTMMLGDLGADVIKVERPGCGDETRQWGPPFLDGESAYYLCCNRNKKSLTLNLKDERGIEIARELAVRSDVLVENFRVGGLNDLGLGYEELSKLNPGLIYCSISGFGHTGPDRDLPGYDFIIQGRGGYMSVTGDEDGSPMKVGIAFVDVATAMFASNAILAALFAREKTGVGQHLDLALLDSVVAMLANVGSNFLCSADVPGRWGNAVASIVPYQAFEALDGHLILAVGNDGQWKRFCGAVEREDLAVDERFGTNPERVANRKVLIPILDKLFQGNSVEYWVDLCRSADVPAGPVNSIDQVFSDPQVLERGMFQSLDRPSGETVPMAGSPLNLSQTPVEMRLPPPRLGEHTNEILIEELSLEEQEIRSLHNSSIV